MLVVISLYSSFHCWISPAFLLLPMSGPPLYSPPHRPSAPWQADRQGLEGESTIQEAVHDDAQGPNVHLEPGRSRGGHHPCAPCAATRWWSSNRLGILAPRGDKTSTWRDGRCEVCDVTQCYPHQVTKPNTQTAVLPICSIWKPAAVKLVRYSISMMSLVKILPLVGYTWIYQC